LSFERKEAAKLLKRPRDFAGEGRDGLELRDESVLIGRPAREAEAELGVLSIDNRRVGVLCAYAKGIEGTGGLFGESYTEKRAEFGVLGALTLLEYCCCCCCCPLGLRDEEEDASRPKAFLKKPLVLRMAFDMDCISEHKEEHRERRVREEGVGKSCLSTYSVFAILSELLRASTGRAVRGSRRLQT